MKIFRFSMGILIIITAIGTLVWFSGPGLKADYELLHTPKEVLSDYRVTKAECRVFVFLFSACTISINNGQFQSFSGRNTPKFQKYNFRYAFIGNASGAEVQILKIPSRPDVVTTNIAFDYFYNRLAGFIVAILLLLALPVIGIVKLINGTYQ